jgi:hypothetical protein
METATSDIVCILVLIIPIHGIFLSLFFFTHAKHDPGPNFLLGTLLVVLSLPGLFQLILLQYSPSCFLPKYFSSCELCITPFLLQYNSTLIQSWPKNTTFCRLPVFYIAAWVILTCIEVYSNSGILLISMYMIHGLCLLTSVCLIKVRFTQRIPFFGPIPNPDSAWILILNVLVVESLLISMVIIELCPGTMLYLTLLPKGLVVYYIYYRVLNRADFKTA